MLHGYLNPKYNDSSFVKNEFKFICTLPEFVLNLISNRKIKNLRPNGWFQQVSMISFYLAGETPKGDYYELQVFNASPECPYGALGVLHPDGANKSFCFSDKVEGIEPYPGYK